MSDDKWSRYLKDKGIRTKGELVCLVDINTVLGLKNIRQSLKSIGENGAIQHKCMTPKGTRNMVFVSRSIVRRLVAKMRYPVDRGLYAALDMEYENSSRFYPSVEAQIVTFIEKTFEGEIMQRQYNVDGYLVDLFFPLYNLAIEIDEHNHVYYPRMHAERQTNIERRTGCTFIRVCTDDVECLSKCCNEIFKHIKKVLISSSSAMP